MNFLYPLNDNEYKILKRMAIICAILQLFLSHLLQKIPTVFFVGVGQFPLSHDRAVFTIMIVGKIHDYAVGKRWNRDYLKWRFGLTLSNLTDLKPTINYPFRFYLFRILMADNIRRALQNINLGIDDAPIALPQAVVQRALDDNQFCLVGRPLMPRKQDIRQIIASLPRTWGLMGFVRGRLMEHRRFQFILPSEESLATVLRRGPWSFADRMLGLERWSPNDAPPMLNMIPFWIQIRGIPVHFMNLGVIDNIAQSLGEVMGVDFDEATVTRVQFVRVQVKWNVENPLRFQRNFQFSPRVNTTLSFFYE